mgnify:CR=1 FL=1
MKKFFAVVCVTGATVHLTVGHLVHTPSMLGSISEIMRNALRHLTLPLLTGPVTGTEFAGRPAVTSVTRPETFSPLRLVLLDLHVWITKPNQLHLFALLCQHGKLLVLTGRAFGFVVPAKLFATVSNHYSVLVQTS